MKLIYSGSWVLLRSILQCNSTGFFSLILSLDKNTSTSLHPKHLLIFSHTSVSLSSSICPSASMRRLAVSVMGRPFLYQVMMGGGTALDSHSKVTDLPTCTFNTTGRSPLLCLMLGGTGKSDTSNLDQWLCRNVEILNILFVKLKQRLSTLLHQIFS